MKRTLMITTAAAMLFAAPAFAADTAAEQAKSERDPSRNYEGPKVKGGHSGGTMTEELTAEVPTMDAKDGAHADTKRDNDVNLEGKKVKGGHSGGTMTKELGNVVPEVKPDAAATESSK